MNKIKILIIDDDIDRLRVVRDALVNNTLRNGGKPVFDQNFEAYPKESEFEKFCNKIQTLDEKKLYFEIYKLVEEQNIDIVFTDLSFKVSDKIGSSSGEKLIQNLLNDNLHKELPIVAYSRNTDGAVNLNEAIRSKIVFAYVGSDVDDAIEIRRKFNQVIVQRLLLDKVEEYKKHKNNYDLAIICALDKEYDAVKSLITDDEWINVDRKYKRAYWEDEKKQIILKIILTSMNNNMGMVEATLRTLELINLAKPVLVAMTGIAGGSKSNEARLGDICAAKTVDNWQSGKYVSGGRFELAPEVKEIAPTIKEIIESHITDKTQEQIIEDIINEYGQEKVNELITQEIKTEQQYAKKLNTEEKNKYKHTIRQKDRLPEFKFVDMMTGSSLVADEQIIEQGMLQRNSKAFFFDMEGYAVARVSHTKGCKWIVIKAIVDYGNHQKGDEWHEFASFASAKFLYELSFDILRENEQP